MFFNCHIKNYFQNTDGYSDTVVSSFFFLFFVLLFYCCFCCCFWEVSLLILWGLFFTLIKYLTDGDRSETNCASHGCFIPWTLGISFFKIIIIIIIKIRIHQTKKEEKNNTYLI